MACKHAKHCYELPHLIYSDPCPFISLLCYLSQIRIRREVVLVVLQKLENLLLWMKSQSHLEFYCSSILIVYDGYQGAEYSTRHRGTEHARIDAETSEVKHFLQHLGPQFPEPHPAKPPKSMDAATPLSPCGWDDMPESDFCSAPIAVPATTSPKSPLSAASLGYHHRPPLDLENQVHVKMIDFAHALPGNGSVNTGYMIGLRSLISRLHRIASMHDQLPKSMLTQRF